jgi:predicted DsbA family dithiol-disulfide isomerase
MVPSMSTTETLPTKNVLAELASGSGLDRGMFLQPFRSEEARQET